MRAEPVEAHTEEEPITSLLRFDLPGIIGDLDADDLHSKVGKIGLDCGSCSSIPGTSLALSTC